MATGIDTVKGTASFQDETYGWRSDGLRDSRAVGAGATADTEVFAYDHLGRLSARRSTPTRPARERRRRWTGRSRTGTTGWAT